MSKFIVANLASAFVLIAAGSVFAAPDSNSSSPPADQSSASSSAPAAQSQAPSTAAATPASQPTPAQAAKKKSPSDIICKPDVGTGSRVGGAKICLTREQWREHED